MIDTAPNLTLVLVAGALTAVGVYLLLERSLTRVLLGVIFVGNAVNVVFLVAGGRAGGVGDGGDLRRRLRRRQPLLRQCGRPSGHAPARLAARRRRRADRTP